MWSPNCPDDAELVEITPELQQIFLDSHNTLRNQQAFGQTPGFAPAKRMATMVIFNIIALKRGMRKFSLDFFYIK